MRTVVVLMLVACGGSVGSEPAVGTPAPIVASDTYEVPPEAGARGGNAGPSNPPSLEEMTAGGGPKPR